MKLISITALLGLAVAGSAMAQETQSTNQAGVVSVAPQAQQQPTEYVRSIHEDWAIKCAPSQQNTQCYMTQLVVGQNNTPLMEVTFIPASIESEPTATMGGTITTPLNVLLTRGVLVQVDEELPDSKTFTYCSPVGCNARFPVFPEQIDLYKKAEQMTVVVFSMQNTQQGLEIPVSLKGFSDAHDTLFKIESGELSVEPVEAEAPAS